jgi:hypothetical protein
VERAEQSGLVRAKKSQTDRRVVVVSLTPRGLLILSRLAQIHHEQARNLQLFIDASRPNGGRAPRRASPGLGTRAEVPRLRNRTNHSERAKSA